MGFLIQETFAEFVRVANLPEGERIRGIYGEAVESLARGGWQPDPGEWSDVAHALRRLELTPSDLFADAVRRRDELGIALSLADIMAFTTALDESNRRFADASAAAIRR